MNNPTWARIPFAGELSIQGENKDVRDRLGGVARLAPFNTTIGTWHCCGVIVDAVLHPERFANLLKCFSRADCRAVFGVGEEGHELRTGPKGEDFFVGLVGRNECEPRLAVRLHKHDIIHFGSSEQFGPRNRRRVERGTFHRGITYQAEIHARRGR